jgi:hypothetical protein
MSPVTYFTVQLRGKRSVFSAVQSDANGPKPTVAALQRNGSYRSKSGSDWSVSKPTLMTHSATLADCSKICA